VICYCYKVWYKEEDKEASKPVFLYTDTIRYDTIGLHGGRIGGIFITGIFGNFYTKRGQFLTFKTGIPGGLAALAFVVSRTVSEIRRLIGRTSPIRTHPTLIQRPCVGWPTSNFGMNVISPETRMMELPYGEEIIIIGRTMWTQSTSVTDRQTDRITITIRQCNA